MGWGPGWARTPPSGSGISFYRKGRGFRCHSGRTEHEGLGVASGVTLHPSRNKGQMVPSLRSSTKVTDKDGFVSSARVCTRDGRLQSSGPCAQGVTQVRPFPSSYFCPGLLPRPAPVSVCRTVDIHPFVGRVRSTTRGPSSSFPGNLPFSFVCYCRFVDKQGHRVIGLEVGVIQKTTYG